MAYCPKCFSSQAVLPPANPLPSVLRMPCVQLISPLTNTRASHLIELLHHIFADLAGAGSSSRGVQEHEKNKHQRHFFFCYVAMSGFKQVSVGDVVCWDCPTH